MEKKTNLKKSFWGGIAEKVNNMPCVHIFVYILHLTTVLNHQEICSYLHSTVLKVFFLLLDVFKGFFHNVNDFEQFGYDMLWYGL